MAEMSGDVYLIGGGIASLAAAVFLIRDAGCDGRKIHLLEGDQVLGGSLDASGDAEVGYRIRGGRMFEEHFACTYDLLSEIPTLDQPDCSVTDDIRSFTREVVTSSRCRLVNDQKRIEAPDFGLSARDKWELIRLSLVSERSLGSRTIEQYFSSHFLASNFWHMWCTMFAFQSWHSVAEMRRYMRRFMHLLPGFNRLEGIHRTRFNQYDSIVRPLTRWLQQHQVSFHLDAAVTSVTFNDDATRVRQIEWLDHGVPVTQEISSADKVLVTLGSMTEGATFGSMSHAPVLAPEVKEGAWPLWQQIAGASANFGDPDRFASDPSSTLWTSFTVTLKTPHFFDFMASFTGNQAGTGGLVTFRNSGWLLSVVIAGQPHFAAQNDDTFVFWGYGLHPQEIGDAVAKPMLKCNGQDILAELAHHLGLGDQMEIMFSDAICIPCLMPYITAQFMPRTPGDRPAVLPAANGNFAFLGQFCEMPDDTVFTVEYSVRSAQQAVYALFDTSCTVPPLYRGFEKPSVIGRALRKILSNGRSG